jgi:hypothetical protein
MPVSQCAHSLRAILDRAHSWRPDFDLDGQAAFCQAPSMKTILQLLTTFLAFLCLSAGAPKAEAVVPPPDGGYPNFNTAEGQNALFSLTTGAANTAVGWFSLWGNAAGSFNTAAGVGALLFNTADNNTAFGAAALLFNMTGGQNTAVGTAALLNNDDGTNNTAVGFQALELHTTGAFNNAFGRSALAFDQSGASNNAFGAFALQNNISGVNNTAVGDLALAGSTGDSNTAVGAGAGSNATTGSGNVYIGAEISGVIGDSNHTYIRNINTTTVSGGGADSVTVNLGTGLLGHASSSRRYKEAIKPMEQASEVLYALKPVTYRYKKNIDPSQSLDYGLVAEDVAEVDPNLATRGAEGKIETVRYSAINAMLLNEFLKEHRKVETLEAKVAELAARVERVSAQVQVEHSAAQVAVNNH